MRLIDADALIEVLVKERGLYPTMLASAIKIAPTIDPVKRGEWINTDGYDEWHCSECGFEINTDNEHPTEYDNFRYCGCCGAKMEKE